MAPKVPCRRTPLNGQRCFFWPQKNRLQFDGIVGRANGFKIWIFANNEVALEARQKIQETCEVGRDVAVLICSSSAGFTTDDDSVPVIWCDTPWLEALYPGGNPHLLQRALSFCVSRGSRIEVIGADMYSQPNPYLPGSVLAQTQKFEVCLATAIHNPILNYNFTRLLHGESWITGDEVMTNACSLGLRKYLSQLDINLGLARR